MDASRVHMKKAGAAKVTVSLIEAILEMLDPMC